MSARRLHRLRLPGVAVLSALLVLDPLTTLAQIPGGVSLPGTSRQEISPQTRVRPPDSPIEGRTDPAVPDAPPDTDGADVPDDPDGSLTFRLNGVNLIGATVYETAEFDDILADFVGTDVTLGGLREIGNRIERKYRDDGYVATRVIIPPQAIKNGVPSMEIFEGKIIHYEINGEIGDVKKRIAMYLDNLLTDKPARWGELERYLLISRDLPGISLTGTLRSAGDSTPGGVILVVDAARKAVDGYVNIQNRNPEVIGPWTLSGGVSFNSNTEYGERLGGVALVSMQKFEPVFDDSPFEQKSFYFIYEHALGDEGLRFNLSGTLGFTKPGNELRDLQLETDSAIFRFELEYPAIRSRSFSLWTRGGFEISDQRAVIAEEALYDDQVRSFFFGMTGIWFAPLGGVTEFDFELRQGLDHYGAPKFFSTNRGAIGADSRSRFDARFDHTVVRGRVSHRQPLPPWFELYFEFAGQASSRQLPAIEECVLGTLTIGRGYDAGSITGDTCFGAVFEARYVPPGMDLWWLDNLQFYGFMDYGRAYDFGNPTNSTTGYEDLFSVGFGSRFQVFETVYGDVYLAMPQSRGISIAPRRPNPTVHLNLTKYF